MAQDFDKVFKENIEEIILPLAEKILDIHPYKLLEIPDNIQKTIERQPDFLKMVLDKEDKPEYILHIEFQTFDDPKMVKRMLFYWAMLYNKYEVASRQYVIYFGKAGAKMPVLLSHENIQFSFHLINMQDINYNIFLDSDKPEEIMLGILANFGEDAPGKVIESILRHIKSLPLETNRIEKCVKQLEILSKLRNLQREVINKITDMALIYDLKTDLRYLQGREEEKKERIDDILINMLKNTSLSIDEIAKIVNTSVDYVKKIAEKLKNK